MKTKKLTFKNVKFNALPKSYKEYILEVCKNKTDDFPKTFWHARYRFTVWTLQDPIEISNF